MVIAVSVDKDRSACCVCNLIAVRRGCPAEEFVACGGGKFDLAKRFYGCGRILRVTAVYKGLRAAALEIIMIRNRHGLGLIGVDCRQRGVLCDGNLIARVDELVVFRFPSAEVFGIFRRKYAGGAAAYILLVIYFFALALNVCDREAVLCGGEERRNRNGAVKLGIYIEQRAVRINPSGGLFLLELFKQCLKIFGIRKLCAVLNIDRSYFAVRRGRQVNLSFNNRRLPLCIERNVLCGHRLAVEDICRAFAKLVLIPTSKHEVCGYTGRFCRVVVGIGNTLLILAANLAILCTVIHENDIIGFTIIIELCTIVVPANTRAFTFIKLKACNCISVFFSNPVTCSVNRILMIQLVFSAGNGFEVIRCNHRTT